MRNQHPNAVSAGHLDSSRSSSWRSRLCFCSLTRGQPFCNARFARYSV